MEALTIADPAERENLAAFVGRVLRLDEAAVVRLRRRGDGRLSAWAPTGFDAVAVRVVDAVMGPSDVTVAANTLRDGLENGSATVDLGFPMDSAWRGALPPDTGFVHVDDVPARVLVELARQGSELAREHTTAPTSLLDQEVLAVEGDGERVAVPMRVVFALTAMGFVPYADTPERIDTAEIVRVRAHKTWLRLDARYGSVAKRRVTLRVL